MKLKSWKNKLETKPYSLSKIKPKTNCKPMLNFALEKITKRMKSNFVF